MLDAFSAIGGFLGFIAGSAASLLPWVSPSGVKRDLGSKLYKREDSEDDSTQSPPPPKCPPPKKWPLPQNCRMIHSAILSVLPARCLCKKCFTHEQNQARRFAKRQEELLNAETNITDLVWQIRYFSLAFKYLLTPS